MRVLAIDTGAGTSVAVGELIQGEFALRAFVSFEDRFGHAENIGVALRDALAAADWTPDSQLLVVANHGPAGYTGLRVGLAAATAFSATIGAPVLGISSLASAAFRFFSENPTAAECTIALEAKRRELFFQKFARGPSSLLPLSQQEPTLLPLDELPEPLPKNWVIEPADAASIAELGTRQWQLHPHPHQTGLSAQYLRQPDVTPGSGKRVSG